MNTHFKTTPVRCTFVQIRRNCIAKNSNLHIFQVNHPRCDVSLQYIQEIMDCTKNLKENDRRDIFESNGINYTNVCKYYNIVQSIENTYNKNTNIFNISKIIFTYIVNL